MTIDDLAAEIRRVDGNHSFGAGALAEALMPFILRALDEAKWQPIETAPLWQEVIVYQKSASPTKSNKTGVFTAVRVEKGWALTRFGPTTTHNPTHWMPLPTPPATKDTQDE